VRCNDSESRTRRTVIKSLALGSVSVAGIIGGTGTGMAEEECDEAESTDTRRNECSSESSTAVGTMDDINEGGDAGVGREHSQEVTFAEDVGGRYSSREITHVLGGGLDIVEVSAPNEYHEYHQYTFRVAGNGAIVNDAGDRAEMGVRKQGVKIETDTSYVSVLTSGNPNDVGMYPEPSGSNGTVSVSQVLGAIDLATEVIESTYAGPVLTAASLAESLGGYDVSFDWSNTYDMQKVNANDFSYGGHHCGFVVREHPRHDGSFPFETIDITSRFGGVEATWQIGMQDGLQWVAEQ